MSDDLDALREAAKLATPGHFTPRPWDVHAMPLRSREDAEDVVRWVRSLGQEAEITLLKDGSVRLNLFTNRRTEYEWMGPWAHVLDEGEWLVLDFGQQTIRTLSDEVFRDRYQPDTRATPDPAAVAGELPVSVLAGALLAKENVKLMDAPFDEAARAAEDAMPFNLYDEEPNYHAVVGAYLRALSEQGDRGDG